MRSPSRRLKAGSTGENAPPATHPGRPAFLLAAAWLGYAWMATLAGAATPQASAPAGRALADGAGRKVIVPAKIDRVYATSPVAAVVLYTLAPEKMVGWNYRLGEREKRFLLPAVRDLPALGGWFGETGKGNRESLLASRPHLILSIGYNDATEVDFADRLQAQVGVPVYSASGRFREMAATYERLGELLGVRERAAALAAYTRRTLEDTAALAASVPPAERVRVYYAEGLRGLQTDTKGSMHTEPLDYLGMENVAQGPETTGFGRVSVSPEQVIAWRPDVLLVCREKSGDAGLVAPEWLRERSWLQVPAVADGRIYSIPSEPFNWFDRPPSVARLLGLRWLLWVLYPERVTFDMIEETRGFYRLFYRYEMAVDEARAMLEASKVRLKSESEAQANGKKR